MIQASRRRARAPRWSALVLVAACACVAPRVVLAAVTKPVVAIAPFRGPAAILAERTVVRALAKRARVLSPSRYALVAKGLGAAGSHAPEDIAVVAKEMAAAWVVTGTVKAEGRHWSLTVNVRDGDDGESRAKLRYTLAGPRIPPRVLRTLGAEIADALATAVRAPKRSTHAESPAAEPAARTEKPASRPETPAPPPEPVPAEAPAQPTVEPKPAPAPSPPATRPRWARWFELAVGGTIRSRSFATDPQPPLFRNAVVGGLRLEGTAYPLAFTWNKAYGVFSGLGLGLTYDKPFWPDSTAKVDSTQRFATTEQMIEGGLRWKFTLYRPMPRPQLTLLVEGGLHQFSFAKGSDGTALVSVPDTRYVYALVGGRLTVHFAEWSWIWLQFAYLAVTDTGPIQSPEVYGLAAAYGLRFSGGLDFLAWKGLRIGAAGLYERFAIRFGYDPNHRAIIKDGATDEYYGGMLLVGYVL